MVPGWIYARGNRLLFLDIASNLLLCLVERRVSAFCSLSQLCRHEIDYDYDSGYDGQRYPHVCHRALTFRATTMPGNRAMAVSAGSSANSAAEAGRCHVSTR